jgi:hypothetical protein
MKEGGRKKMMQERKRACPNDDGQALKNNITAD